MAPNDAEEWPPRSESWGKLFVEVLGRMPQLRTLRISVGAGGLALSPLGVAAVVVQVP
jgi:hypothetical protein